jgi:hypothetical protein
MGMLSQKQKISWKKKTEMVRRNFSFEFNATNFFTVPDDDFDDDYGDIRHRILGRVRIWASPSGFLP